MEITKSIIRRVVELKEMSEGKNFNLSTQEIIEIWDTSSEALNRMVAIIEEQQQIMEQQTILQMDQFNQFLLKVEHMIYNSSLLVSFIHSQGLSEEYDRFVQRHGG